MWLLHYGRQSYLKLNVVPSEVSESMHAFMLTHLCQQVESPETPVEYIKECLLDVS